jgi:hypothetical protein
MATFYREQVTALHLALGAGPEEDWTEVAEPFEAAHGQPITGTFPTSTHLTPTITGGIGSQYSASRIASPRLPPS